MENQCKYCNETPKLEIEDVLVCKVHATVFFPQYFTWLYQSAMEFIAKEWKS